MKKLSALIALSLLATSSAYAQTCADALPLTSNGTFTSDTTGTTNWLFTFGPVISPSNDQLYTFTAGPGPYGSITPTSASYQFAMYLIPSCADTGTEPTPIGNTATVGTGINLASIPSVTEGNTYFLAVTGTNAGGAGANGTVTFTTGTLPVTLESFSID
jgi:hypothetical protein